MKILVTGGCGFIGSNFIIYLLKNHPEDTVVNLDKLTYAGNLSNLSQLSKDRRYSFIKGDISDRKIVMEVIKGCDAVVNFAAESHVDRSIAKPAPFIQTNFVGVSVLLEASRKVRLKRFLQVSTDEVYGSIPEKRKANEKSLLKPSSPYSASKAAADLLCLSYFHTYKLPILITRSSNNYGPRQHPEKLIPLFIQRALSNQPLPLYGTGENLRDWLYVEDNCLAIDLVLRQGKEGEIYNIGTGKYYSNLQVAKMVLKILGKPFSLIQFVPDRPGHDWRYAVACSKIEALGWKPRVKFEDGLRDTVTWYQTYFLNNKD